MPELVEIWRLTMISSGMTFLNSIKSILKKKEKPSYEWYHGALFLVAVTAVERGFEALIKKQNPKTSADESDRDFYRELKRPVFAPPAKAFPVAWAICDIALIWGNLRVLNMPAQTAGRREYLALQAASWGIYSLFTALHFGLRSPLNAWSLTAIHAGLNIASEAVALNSLKDKKVALAHAPVLSWLTLALPVATTTALWNREPPL